MVRLIAAAAGLAIAGSALAGIEASFEWRLVDNTVGNPGSDAINGALWNSNNWATYDLFLTGNFVVNGVNLGSAPGEESWGLNFAGVDFFNTAGFVASDLENGAQVAFAASLYDSYVDLGSNNPGGNATNQMITLGLNGVTPNAQGVLRGAWAHNPQNGGTPQNAANGIRLLRISVDADDVMGTVGSGIMQIGTPQGNFLVNVPAIIPTPGAVALLGLGGLAAARRRR